MGREVGAMAGVYLPLHPMEHQYIVTDEIPMIYERDNEHPHVMDPSGESYLRQEGRGLCIRFMNSLANPGRLMEPHGTLGTNCWQMILIKSTTVLNLLINVFPCWKPQV